MTDTAPAPKAPIRWLAEIRFIFILCLAVMGLHSFVAKPFYIPSESMMPELLVGDRILVSKYAYGWSYASLSLQLLPFIEGRLFGRLPERGDMVILTPPGDARRGEDLIKRVIGLPGDTVQMIAGRLWLNGAPVAVEDRGERLMAVDGNFHCDANDADRERAFPGFADARVSDRSGQRYCRLHVVRETLPNGASYDTLDFGLGPEDDTAPYVVPAGRIFVMGDNRDNSADSRVPVAESGLGGAVPFENITGRAEFVAVSLNGDAGWNPLTWFSGFRSNRAGASLRPARAK